MAEYRFEVPEDMRAQAEPGIPVPDAVVVTLDPAIYHGCMVHSVYGDQRHPNDGERVAVAILLRRVLELEAKMAFPPRRATRMHGTGRRRLWIRTAATGRLERL